MANKRPLMIVSDQVVSPQHLAFLRAAKRKLRYLEELSLLLDQFSRKPIDSLVFLSHCNQEQIEHLNEIAKLCTRDAVLILVCETDCQALNDLARNHRHVHCFFANEEFDKQVMPLLEQAKEMRAKRAANDDMLELPKENLFQQMLGRTIARAKRYNRITALLLIEIESV